MRRVTYPRTGTMRWFKMHIRRIWSDNIKPMFTGDYNEINNGDV